MSQTVLVSSLMSALAGYLIGKDRRPTDTEVVDNLRSIKPTLFQSLDIDTSEARDKKEYSFVGYSMFVQNPEDASLSVYLRVNESDAEPIDITKVRKIHTPFYRFFITNSAGTGTLTVLICKTPVLELAEANLNVQVIASSVTIDINVTASDIMMPIDVQGSYIMLPIDIQGSYIMMPVDIQAQYVTLDIDIVAQTVGNINIDIAAQTVGNLNVNIAASAVTITVSVTGTANISITAQSVGVYLQPDWQAKEGRDKNFRIEGTARGWLEGGYIAYIVPTGRTLYITGMSIVVRPSLASNSVYNHNATAYIYNATNSIFLAQISGFGGAGLTFSKPFSISTGKVFRLYIYCYSNFDCELTGYAWGYEIY